MVIQRKESLVKGETDAMLHCIIVAVKVVFLRCFAVLVESTMRRLVGSVCLAVCQSSPTNQRNVDPTEGKKKRISLYFS